MPPEQFEIVLKTGEIPSLYEQLLKLLATIFGQGEKAKKLEPEYIIVLAQAYERGYTTVGQISKEMPKFVELEVEMQPMIADLATEQILQGPEQKLIKDREAAPELTYPEVSQIPETSTAEATAPATSGGGESVVK